MHSDWLCSHSYSGHKIDLLMTYCFQLSFVSHFISGVVTNSPFFSCLPQEFELLQPTCNSPTLKQNYVFIKTQETKSPYLNDDKMYRATNCWWWHFVRQNTCLEWSKDVIKNSLEIFRHLQICALWELSV